MIDAKAINTLNSIKQYYNDKDQDFYVGFDDEDNEALEMAIKALKQTRWIPVSERLPEKEGLYLVSVKNEHDRRYSKTCWFHGDDNWFARQDVIAWMPLPEPYKAESEE